MLSRSAEYALRIMAYMAVYSSEEPIRAKDLATEVNIPGSYLSKIMRRMVTAGLLKGSRGHGGGFLIAKPPSKIKFSHILEAIEGGAPLARPCVFGWDICSDKSPCVLHSEWKKIKRSYEGWARKTSLADLQRSLSSDGYNVVGLSGTDLRRRIKKAISDERGKRASSPS